MPSVNRTERLLDLIALLVNARRPVPFEEIRRAFPDDYGDPDRDDDSDGHGDGESAREQRLAAARRKFERDKKDLLELGIPLEYVTPSEDDEDEGREGGGYVVDRRRAFLPSVALGREEMAALYLVALSTASDPTFPYREALVRALRKIELGAGFDSGGAPATAPSLFIDRAAAPPALALEPTASTNTDVGAATLRARVDALTDAVRRRKRVRFTYRALRGAAVTAREVEPYGLVWRAGRWSLVGRALPDGERPGGVRTFLVHRVSDLEVNPAKPGSPDFAPPDGFRLADHARVPPHRFDVHAPVAVTLDVADDAVWLLERALGGPPLARTPSPARRGFTRVEVETTFVDALCSTVLRLGPRLAVVGPPEVRARVVATLRRLVAVAEARS